MVVKSKGTSPKSPKNSGLGIILICPDNNGINSLPTSTGELIPDFWLPSTVVSFSKWFVKGINQAAGLVLNPLEDGLPGLDPVVRITMDHPYLQTMFMAI